jgi:uncharacterized protein YpmS
MEIKTLRTIIQAVILMITKLQITIRQTMKAIPITLLILTLILIMVVAIRIIQPRSQTPHNHQYQSQISLIKIYPYKI